MDNSDRIHFLDQVSAEQKSVLLKNAKALFFPSLYEGFGFPALEAMSAGAPIVASSAGALPETIGNAGILLDPRGTGAFAEALDQVLNDNALRRILIDRGFERAKNFSWEKCAEETIKIIRS
jgi:glycosyltransferase involved in cell wall biosynthesis